MSKDKPKFEEHPNSLISNMTPEEKVKLNIARRKYNADAWAMEDWAAHGFTSDVESMGEATNEEQDFSG
jgi:hypothetical protein